MKPTLKVLAVLLFLALMLAFSSIACFPPCGGAGVGSNGLAEICTGQNPMATATPSPAE